ncbi:MAG: type II toxin-antitoxin system RelB/DinJ family antitoxin [Lentisphaerae bacterium]|nr:type II toxin-antitoxin system RelB/DinJ family antitoxin [Lentisphaerota bacterium]
MSSVKTTTARVRIRPEIKSEAEDIIHALGLSVSTAFELFYRQIILNRGLPFDVRIPNTTTRKAVEDARKRHGEKFATTEALFKDLGI